jgi:hypothetical protein
VAWAFGYFAKYQSGDATYQAMTNDPIRVDPLSGDRMGPPGVAILKYSAIGAERVTISMVPWTIVDDPVFRRPIEELWPRWGAISGMTAQDVFDSKPEHQLGYAARGWPMLSMWCAFEHGHGMPRGGIALHVSQTPGTFIGTEHVLPLRPSWPGFAVNTALYAAATWLVFFAAPRLLRRLTRRLRGLCAHCGYDLRGQPAKSTRCPECGCSTTTRP